MLRPIKPSSALLNRAFSFALGLLACSPASANPEGMQVVTGTVTSATPNTQTLEITNSPGAILNWQGFDIGTGEVTRFIQQDTASAVLNRVTTQNSSEIFGQLLSNGQVFLINSAGILIGRDAVVDTAGMVLSTLNIKDADFTAGHYKFEGDATSGTIANHGYLKSAPNGEIILIAPKILNSPIEGNEKSGLIESENGDLVLAAGYALTISSLDDPDVSFEVQAPENEVINIGQLLAKGGTASVLAGTIRHSGEINADSLSVDDTGHVRLVASTRVTSTAESKISAQGAEGLAGGQVEIEGAQVALSGEVNVSGDTAGGTIHVLGDAVELTGATLSADATHGAGGQIRVGGEYQGGAALRAAETTKVDSASRLTANAGENGDGGKIVVWSDHETDFKGSAATRGGLQAGNGGLVEVSGKEILRFTGNVDVGAPGGEAGTLLLDPRFIFIVNGGATVSVSDATAALGDQLGGSFTSVSTLANGNILVINQAADVGGLTDAGKVLLFDTFGNQLGSLAGNAANERLGAFGQFATTGGNRFFASPFASAGGLAQAGAFILFDLVSGKEIGRTSGTSANELFSLSGTVDSLAGNFVIGSNLADVNGADSGSVVTVSGTTGLALGRISGAAAGDQFGSNVTTVGVNTFRIIASGADIGGNVDAGAVITGSALTGLEIGRITGAAAGDQIGSNVATFAAAANTFRIVATGADIGGIVNAGTVIIGNTLTGLEIGRTSGQSDNEFYGSNIFFDSFGEAPTGKMLVSSASADLGGTGNGFDNAGTVVLVDKVTGIEVGRTSGLTAGDSLGSLSPIMRASGNYFLRVPNATVSGNAFAGSLVLISGTTGTRIGSVDGTAAGEFLSQGSSVDASILGASDVLLTDSDHDNPGIGTVNDRAGGVFFVADVDLGGGNILRGSVLGQSQDDFFGSSGVAGTTSTGLIFANPTGDSGGFTDSGAVVLISFTGTELGRVAGTSTNELLGQATVLPLSNGNYFIRSRLFDTGGGVVDAGSVILADGATGNLIGRFDGNTAFEQVGNVLFVLDSNENLVVLSTGHNGGAGIAAQLAITDLGSGNIVAGSVQGLVVGDLTGANIVVRPFGNYLVTAPNMDVGGTVNAGSVFAVDDASGTTLIRIDGNQTNEGLGANIQTDIFDTLGGTLADTFAILSPGHGANSEGAVFFVNSEAGVLTRQIDGSTSETLGTRQLEVVQGGNIAIRSPFDSSAFANGGSIRFVNAFSNFTDTGLVTGISANEQLGGASTIINTDSLSGSHFLIHTPDRDVSGKTDAGAVLLMNGVSGSVSLLGAISGLETNDFLGAGGSADIQQLSSGNFVLFNPTADNPAGTPGDGNQEGAVILAALTGAELGRLYGRLDNENLSSVGFVRERANGNYFVQSSSAGVNNEGTLYLANGTNGTQIGLVDGTAPSEFFSSNIDESSLANDILVFSENSNIGGPLDSGSIVQVADVDLGGGNIVRGRINGSNANELLGRNGINTSPDGLHYFAVSDGASGAGSIYFVNIATGTQTNRIDGGAANDFLGSESPFQGTNGNLFLRNQFADVGGVTDAGRLIVADSAGNVLGQLAGNTTNERLSSSFQFQGSNSDMWVFAPLHSSGAGAIFATSDQNFGGGNIVRASLLGATAGDGIGALGINFITGTTGVVRAPDADVGGIVDAGTAILINTELQEIGRTNGTSADERFSNQFFNVVTDGNLLYRSQFADVNGLVDAGTVKLVSGTTGTLIGETKGTTADEQFGAQSVIGLGNNGIAIESPDADVGSFTKAGAIVQIDTKTGLEIQRVVGISANERLGAFGFFFLGSGRVGFNSPLADVNGVTDAGRLVFFDPTAANDNGTATDLLFSNTPDGDFIVTTGAIQNALNGGANLILQANSDIVIEKGTVLTATGGSLTLQAGRSILVNGLLNMPETALRLIANESAANGVDLDNRGSGSGDFILEDPQVVGKTIEISAESVRLFGGSDPAATNVLQTTSEFFENFLLDGKLTSPATFVFGLEGLSVVANEVELVGGSSPGAFAALVSGGEFTVDASRIILTAGSAPGAHALFLGLGGLGEFTFDECIGCGETLLFTDPFLEDGPTTGLFIAGLFQEPTVNSILSMLDQGTGAGGDDSDDDDDEDDDTKECGI